MPVEVRISGDGKVLEVDLQGVLHAEDYGEIEEALGRMIRERGKARILWRPQELRGWDLGALWQELKFDLRHFDDVERVALVGEPGWGKGAAVYSQALTTAQVRYFQPGEAEAAREWLMEELSEGAGRGEALEN